jgi:hypothetical protein
MGTFKGLYKFLNRPSWERRHHVRTVCEQYIGRRVRFYMNYIPDVKGEIAHAGYWTITLLDCSQYDPKLNMFISKGDKPAAVYSKDIIRIEFID